MADYVYTNIKCFEGTKDGESTIYKWTVDLQYWGTHEYELVVFDKIKKTRSWREIAGEIIMDWSDKVAFFKWDRWTSGTIIKWKLRANLKKAMSYWDESAYELSFVEKELNTVDSPAKDLKDVEKDTETDDVDLPF